MASAVPRANSGPMSESAATTGQVITFYSYKGGTGRTMALANVACLLAQSVAPAGTVLMIDWDLEAPGLHRFFQGLFTRQFAEAPDHLRALDAQPGLVDLFAELDAATHQADGRDEAAAAAALESARFERFVLETDIPSLHLLKAGKFDAGYSTLVNRFDWEGLYNRSPLLFSLFAERLTQQYRFVLIDSRTGLTDTSGICTTLMPERLVVVFTPNRQSLTGVLDLIKQATTYRRASGDLRPLAIFPVPSRIEVSEARLRQDWRLGSPSQGIDGYQTLFESAFREAYDLEECDLSAYFDEVQIPHVPRFAYGEEIAVLTERRGDSLSLGRRYETLADRLVSLAAPWLDRGETRVLPTVVAPAAEAAAAAPAPGPQSARSPRISVLWLVLSPLAAVGLFLLLAYFLSAPPAINEFRVSAPATVAGRPVQLSWSIDRAASVGIEPLGSARLDPGGQSVYVQPDTTTEYTLTAKNWIGLQSSSKLTVIVVRVVSFAASTSQINQEGQEVTLRWETNGASAVAIAPSDEIQDPKPSGEARVHPNESTVYTLTATGPGGVSTNASASIVIGAPSIKRFEVLDPPAGARVYPGTPVRLGWQADGATKIVLSVDKGELSSGMSELDVSGGPPVTVRPTVVGDVQYTLTTSNASGNQVATTKVTVLPISITQFQASPAAITVGSQTTLSWGVDGANDTTTITIDPDIGKVEANGARPVNPTDTTEYVLTVKGIDGQTQQQKSTVIVKPPLPVIVVFTAPTQIVNSGEQVRLTWLVQNADSIEITADDGTLVAKTNQLAGSVIDIPPGPTTYILTATGPSGSTIRDFSIDVRQPGRQASTPIAPPRFEATPTATSEATPTPTPLPIRRPSPAAVL